MLRLPVYLDYNATTPCDPRVLEAMVPYFTEIFGNAASRNHAYGWQAEEAAKNGREQVAKLVGAEPEEIIFTSGATEADNLALKGVFETYSGKGNHIITCNVEHRAVLDACRHLERMGAEITYLKVTNGGLIDLDELEIVHSLDLSTPAEMRLPLRWISILSGQVNTDFALTSGVHSHTDVVKAMMSGAKIAMMASGLLHNGEQSVGPMLSALESWMQEHEYTSIKQMQGSMSQKAVKEPAAFERANYMKVLGSFRDLP